MAQITFKSNSAAETLKTGRSIGKVILGGTILTLEGDLGSGKTLFVKGLAQGLKISQEITSPTFALIQIYHGGLELYHVDLYRLNEKEILELGLEDCWRNRVPTQPQNWALAIEWGNKAKAIFPKEKSIAILQLNFKILSKYSRNIKIEGPLECLKKIQTSLQKS